MECTTPSTPPQPSNAAPYNPPVQPAACGEIQNIRVNVHFVQHDNGAGNFSAINDGRPGNPSTTNTGYEYAQNLIWACNAHMDQSPVLNLAPGSSLNPISKRIRWVLDGVFFDRSTYYRDGSGATTSQVRDYSSLCIKGDSVINLFLVEEVPWPYIGTIGNNNSNNPVARSLANRGYVFSNNQAYCATSAAPSQFWAVVASPWSNYILNGMAPWQIASTVNHEFCHLLGLNHPHEGLSDCSDAPMHPNYPVAGDPSFRQCWNLNEPARPECDAWSKVSNNLMDYTAHQVALSPCQIGTMQYNLNTCLKNRYVYKCSNCLPTTAAFELPEITCDLTNIWLDGRAAWNVHWFKLTIDQISYTGSIIPGSHYEITQWRNPGREQLDNNYKFSKNSTYKVQITSYNNCGSIATQTRTLITSVCEGIQPVISGTSSTAASSTTTPIR